ncbi:hypothetical protein RchiOBHm_Chr5g0043701 [Rosa chinensis]|uniref:Uncharacterized protein n=1 Tax=Rosa chinensis TaxID=74649 RepID=A0A2P6QDE0_ROSCH|nr:hypothetical protein RchiOBHm_Chr5g0043701 [Rosa chinensis]
MINHVCCRPNREVEYKSLVEQGKLQHDPNQVAVASQLEYLHGRLEHYEKWRNII